ncbi:MAG: ferritin [Deltaproteobacteria bacterium]|nr:ferritin [Deltaproteobacteria bacterium]
MKLFRCQICGDPYLGSAPPSFCPFCGASEKYMVPAEAYVDRNYIPDMSPRSRENLETALALEVANAAFYFCASNCAGNPVDQAMFKALAKAESEHASLICKLLQVSKPEIKPDDKACRKDPRANFNESHGRETRAVAFYRQAAAEAVEDRIREIFTALSEIESYHIALSEARK